MILTLASWMVVGLLLLGAGLALKQTGYAFSLVIAMYATEHVLLQNRTGLGLGGSTINLFIGGVCMLSILSAYIRGEMGRFHLPTPAIAGYGLLAYAGASLTWAAGANRGFELYTSAIPYFVVIVVLAPLCMVSPKQTNRFVISTLILGSCICLGLAASNVIHRGVEIVGARGKSETANPLASGSYGGYLVICGLYAFYCFKLSFVRKTAVLFAILLGLYAIAQSGSRGQIVAVAFTGIVWVPIMAKIAARRSFVLAYSFLVVLGLAGYVFLDRLDLLWRFNSSHVQVGASGRFEVAQFMLERMVREGVFSIVFGLGSSASYYYAGGYPHIVLLEVLAEEGIFGFCLFVTFVGGALATFRGLVTNIGLSKPYRAMVCLFAALMTFEAILSFKQGSLIGSQQLFCFAVAGLYVVKSEFADARLESADRPRSVRLHNPTIATTQQGPVRYQ